MLTSVKQGLTSLSTDNTCEWKLLGACATTTHEALSHFGICRFLGQHYTQDPFHLLTTSLRVSRRLRMYVNYSQITAEAAHRSHPAPRAILCCLDGSGGKGENREKNEANCQILLPSNTDTSASKINMAWQSTKAAEKERAHAYRREHTQESEHRQRGAKGKRVQSWSETSLGPILTEYQYQRHISPSLFWSKIASTSLQYSLLASNGILACWWKEQNKDPSGHCSVFHWIWRMHWSNHWTYKQHFKQNTAAAILQYDSMTK